MTRGQWIRYFFIVWDFPPYSLSAYWRTSLELKPHYRGDSGHDVHSRSHWVQEAAHGSGQLPTMEVFAHRTSVQMVALQSEAAAAAARGSAKNAGKSGCTLPAPGTTALRGAAQLVSANAALRFADAAVFDYCSGPLKYEVFRTAPLGKATSESSKFTGPNQ